MHRLMPDFILDEYAAGRMSGEFGAAAMFVDVSGFSAMTDTLMQHGQHGAEVLATVMRAAFAPLIQSVVEQGGFIAIQAGDAFTAIFPRGDNHTQSTRRALAAAWKIGQLAAGQPIHRTLYGDFPISVKVGMSRGDVGWGILQSTSGTQAAYYFRGGAIDSSAEAEHHASGGEVILDPAFQDSVRDLVSTEGRDGFFQLTGMREFLPAPLPITVREQDPALVERFFPSELYAQRHLGEFRQVVYLFVSLEGSGVEARLHPFMQAIFDLQARYGGLLSLHFGDKGAHVMLLWGAPAAHENDVQRALNFVLDLQAREEGRLRAGLTYRIAHAGFIGSGLAEQYAAFGRGANLASRFMSAAPQGTIWLDEYVAQRAEGFFELESAGERSFKGFATPHKAFALRGRRQVSQRFFSGVLVGREAEFARMAEFILPIFEGKYAGLLVVRGEAGMGKSRLIYDYLEHLGQVRPVRFLECLAQSDEILREALNPFVYWLKRYFELSGSEAEDANRERFTGKLEALIAETRNPRLAAELDRTRSFLAAVLGLRFDDSLYEQLDAQARHENSLISLTTLLQAESLRQPVIVVLEDVQWLDAASSNYLPGLMRSLTADPEVEYPIAILATARSGEGGRPLADLAQAEMHLATLDRSGLSALAEAHLGGPASEKLALLLAAYSEGNPFFAEQILRYLNERGLLVQDVSAWTISSDYDRTPLPFDVSAVLMARLDRLAREVKEAVQTAAILGREFEVRLLSHMLRGSAAQPFAPPTEDGILDVVTRAEQEAIWTALDELRYIFRHALLRDTAYEMQLEARRQALHALAVRALETVYREEIPLHYAELAYHADRAALTERARDYYHKAGDAAAEAYQNSQAADYYSRALALTPEGDVGGRYELLSKREEILEVLGDRERRHADLAAMDELARRYDYKANLAHVAMRRARYAFDGGELPETIGFARQAIEAALPLEKWETAILAYALLAQSLARSGKAELAMQEMERGLELAHRSGSILHQSVLYNDLGMLSYEQRDFALAQQNFEKSLALARQAGSIMAEARPLNNLGMVASSLGDFSSAQKYYEAALELDERVGSRRGEAIVLANLGWLAGILGEHAKGREHLALQLRISHEVGDAYSEAYGRINLSPQLAALGDHDLAQKYAQEGLDLAHTLGDPSGEAWALTYLGHSRLAVGNLTGAADSYQRALAIRRELDQPALATEPLAGLARAALAAGDLQSAWPPIKEILAFLDNSGSLNGTDDPLRVYLACYLVLASAKDPRARHILETAYGQLHARADDIHNPEARQAFLTNVEINRLIRESWTNKLDE
jgi:predicted ATPase/class 3 adenylate cyclase